MYTSISEVVRRFKSEWAAELEGERIAEICREVGHTWRDRILDPVSTVQLLLLQILYGNTALSHLRHLSGIEFSASAFCQARMRLPLEVLKRLLEHLSTGAEREDEDSCWFGHRTFMTDGSHFSMPDTPELQQHFGQPKGQQEGCGFPVAHLFALFHAGTGMVLRVLTAPLYSHDLSQTVKFHPELKREDLIVGDRAYCSYGYFAHILCHKLHAVSRVRMQIVNFRAGRACQEPGKHRQKGLPSSRWLKKLGVRDQLVEWRKPKHCPCWMSEAQYAKLPSCLAIRELRYQVGKRGFRTKTITLATTLTDHVKYPAHALADLYRMRWTAETNFGHLKTTMGMDVLRSKTYEGVIKELFAFCIIYNLVRLVMYKAATNQKVDINRISFNDALRWLASLQHHNPLPPLLVLPSRPDRCEPRVKKRRPNQYDLMRKPRAVLKNNLENRTITA